MIVPAYSSFTQWYLEGRERSYVRAAKSPGGILDLLETRRPAGDMHRPAMPDLVLYQDLVGGSRLRGDTGGGYVDLTSEKDAFYLAAPNFALTSVVDRKHRIRALSFPLAHWEKVLEGAADGRFSVESLQLYKGGFHSTTVRAGLRKLWALCEEEGALSRLLAQAAGCEILAELCRLGGAPLMPVKGGLAPWARRRALELLRVRLSEDIGLDELAMGVRLSPFHFARMFKQSFGVPPRVYLTRLRVERACELLEMTDLPITELAHEWDIRRTRFSPGYSSSTGDEPFGLSPGRS